MRPFGAEITRRVEGRRAIFDQEPRVARGPDLPAEPLRGLQENHVWRMGATHILEGVDHLLFLLALLLIVSGFWKLLQTVTAFTLAHSLTLALATLGFVNVPPAPTEAVISLSILFLAAEIVRKRQGLESLTERKPWLVALAFGLFHGLGFAGALSQAGVPAHEVPLSLLMFNVGVETGQVLFVVTVVVALAALRRLPFSLPQGAWRLAPYSIGHEHTLWPAAEENWSFHASWLTSRTLPSASVVPLPAGRIPDR